LLVFGTVGIFHKQSPVFIEASNRYAKLQIPHTRLVVASKAEAEYGITVLEHLAQFASLGKHDQHVRMNAMSRNEPDKAKSREPIPAHI